MTQSPIHVDIVSDVVCPWCIVGYRQLMQAAEKTGTQVEVHWHPFELNPQMPAEGQNLIEHMMEKYSLSRAESDANRERLADVGNDLGFTFAFSENSRMPNTFNTHQLIHWAGTLDRGNDMKQALFTAYFTDQRDLSDDAVLADIAAEIGLDRAQAVGVLDSQQFADATRKEQQFWTQQGISGVPAMVFERKYLVTGAQGAENYENILGQLAGMQATAAE